MIRTLPRLGTLKKSGGSSSHMAWPWHKSRSTPTLNPPELIGPNPLCAALAVADLGRRRELHDHLGVVIAIAVGGLCHLKLILAQQHRENRFNLHLREGGADATVPSRAERNPGPPVDDVGLIGLVVAVRVERVGFGEVLRNSVR